MSDLKYTTHMEGQSNIHTLIWTIPKFPYIHRKKTIREIRCKSEDVKEPRFEIRMLFLGHNSDLIEVYYVYPHTVFLKAVSAVCLRGFEERTIITRDYRTAKAKKWQYLYTLFRRDIEAGGDEYMLEMTILRLKFVFFVTTDIKVQESHSIAPQLCYHLETLLIEGLFSDVTIKSSDGTAFKAHKAVLASRSPVLKAHFEHNTTECQTNIIQSAFETEVLQEILNFIYSDKSDKLDQIPEKLLPAADYYELTRLKILCEESLHKMLTIETAIETLYLADLHSASNLKKLTLDFIKDGQAHLITKTTGWAEVKSVELIKSIYEYIVEDDVQTGDLSAIDD